MNAARAKRAAELCERLSEIDEEIRKLILEEGRMCDAMQHGVKATYARSCNTLYDAKDCVNAAQRYLQCLCGKR